MATLDARAQPDAVAGVSRLDNLEQRVAAVEATLASELPVLRAEAAEALALAAGVYQNLADCRSESRAHTRTLNALRDTQVAHYRELRGTQVALYAEHKADAAEIKAGLGQIVRLYNLEQ